MKQNEESNPPSSGSSTPRVVWLRDRLDTSNCLQLRIPIEIHLYERGLQAICMDSSRLPVILGLSEQAIENLRNAGLVHTLVPIPEPNQRIDYTTLQQTYARMLAGGPFANQTELARHLGVSRVWVSKVVKGIRRRGR